MNWKKKFENKAFWVAIIPATLLLVQAVLGAFGITWDYTAVSEKLLAIVNALFMVLAILGIIVDPNTEGITDKPKDTFVDVDEAQMLGEDYNSANGEDTGMANHATPDIPDEVVIQTDDEGLIGNKLE